MTQNIPMTHDPLRQLSRRLLGQVGQASRDHALIEPGDHVLVAISGGAFGPWVAGFAHDQTGSYAAAFWIAVGAVVLSVFAIWRASPRKVRAVAGRLRQA